MRLLFYPVLYFVFLLQAFSCNAQYLPKHHYKHVVAEKVLNKIAMAKGDNRTIPALKITKNKKNIAMYFAGEKEHSICLDEAAYDLCITMENDSLSALACVIGHELGHYYEDHNDHFGFNDEFRKHDKEAIEDVADKFSLFFGAVAGYNTPKAFPVILNKIYEAYGKSDKLSGYPDLKDRQKIVKNAINETNAFINIYRMGQNLYAIHHYQEAKNCLEFILNHYPSKIIHNNIGVCNLSIYLNENNNQEAYPYIYPFEFDVRVKRINELPTLSKRNHDFKLIDEAIQFFKEAIHIDPYYETAYINLACAYSIRGNQDGASGTINELQLFLEKEGKTLSENAYLMKGISKALNEDYVNAQKAFDQVTSTSDINQFNIAVLEAEMNKESSYFEDFKSWVSSYFTEDDNTINQIITINPDQESIDNTKVPTIVRDSTYKSIDLGNWAYVYYKDNQTSLNYIYKGKSKTIKMIIALDNNQSSTFKGIQFNDDYHKIVSSQYYGFPTFRWNKKPLSIIVYEHGNIGFLLENDKVVNWFTWSTKE
ncbi:hypothetical protein [Flammeovirga sp. SJP92]|uniref:hypothetical protein n=1 Tax=Flammeovirga sp. SJP92 TaxID=1775430 RepID=UPI0007879056|nr:hypothetical protein [Flammeovirga sp. SJP92]KXX69993.1 hypothetical protein AVL50_14040 [Flammeovirga sp. SJP92]